MAVNGITFGVVASGDVAAIEQDPVMSAPVASKTWTVAVLAPVGTVTDWSGIFFSFHRVLVSDLDFRRHRRTSSTKQLLDAVRGFECGLGNGEAVTRERDKRLRIHKQRVKRRIGGLHVLQNFFFNRE